MIEILSINLKDLDIIPSRSLLFEELEKKHKTVGLNLSPKTPQSNSSNKPTSIRKYTEKLKSSNREKSPNSSFSKSKTVITQEEANFNSRYKLN